MKFVHLHVHSEYSLQDSTAKMEDLIVKAKEYGMTHLAITDHGNLYGAFHFEHFCREKGITPIFGVELIVNEFPLVLLAETQEGFGNLLKIVTHANSKGKGKDKVPRITKENLAPFSQGLIALSGGVKGEIATLLLQGKHQKALETLESYVEMFGQGNFFLEITNHDVPEEKEVLVLLSQLSKETGVKMVATNDVHYLEKEHAYARSMLTQLQGDVTPFWEEHTQYSDLFYFASSEEMENRFSSYPESLVTTVEIANRCSGVQIPKQRRLPDFPVPQGYTIETYFEKVTRDGFYKHFPTPTQEYIDRLEYEIKTILKMGFPAYFLIVWDFIKYSKDNGIYVGPGRGSAAGSLVAFSLEITELDPIKYNLLFERFLNPERVTMPDIDIDFDYETRYKVVEYVQQKYGHNKVSQIITFGTLGAKMVIKDFGKMLGFSYKETDEMTREVDEKEFKEEKNKNKSPFEVLTQKPYFEQKLLTDDRVKQLFEIAKVVEGLPRHTSNHAAGVVISQLPLEEVVPLKEEDGLLITQWTMKEIEEVGLLKMDFLGLKTLTIERMTFDHIYKSTGKRLTPQDIPWEDDKTFALLQTGKTGRVFQLESGGMQRTLVDLKPNSFEDIVALLALYRPGPMEHIPTYIENKEKGSFFVLHPAMEPILKVTHGIMVYQEQIMKVAQSLANYSLGEADVLRRAVGKKDEKLLKKQREPFVQKAVANGVEEKTANEVFDLIVRFAEYGFNRSHAAAYAVISVQTAYLKAHYPVEFMAANLTVAIGEAEKLGVILQECKRMGIEILPPHLEKSKEVFTVEDGKIRYGLTGIRNVGMPLAKAIVNSPAFDTLEEYLEHIPSNLYNKATLENLISSGACDHLGNRGTLLHYLSDVMDSAKETQERKKRGQLSFFDQELGMIPKAELPIVPDPPILSLLKEEKRVLEVLLSGHPLDGVQDIVTPLSDGVIADIDDSLNGKRYTVGAVFTNVRVILTKKGNKMAFAIAEDQMKEMEVVIFPKVFEAVQSYLKPSIPLLLTGRVEWDNKEWKPKLVLDSIRPLLSGRQVLYIAVRDENHMNALTKTLASKNGVTSVIFFHKEKRTLHPQSFHVRLNQSTMEALKQEEFRIFAH
ncbi:MAG: DNA polymerase III subunit alpha [Tepidibacillus sp.]